MPNDRHTISGFTLIELLVAMAMGLAAMGSIYMAYDSQQKAHGVQQLVVAIQQNLRAGTFVMSRDIRMAGFDPTGQAGATITEAADGAITVSMDLDTSGCISGADETIRFALTNDANDDGICDGGNCALSRLRDGEVIPQPVAENIDAINFVYLDVDGNVIPTPMIATDPNDLPDLARIRTVQVTIVGRSATGQRGYRKNTVYTNKQGQTVLGAQNDDFHRRVLTAQFKCRNMGL